jgi:hypothetical protein
MASVDEIIDIRKEFSTPLIRFRSAIIGFSGEINNAPWDKDFPQDCERLFHKEVAPSILEIEEAMHSNNYLSALAQKTLEKPIAIPAGTALAIAVSQVSSLPDIAVYAAGIGTAAGTATIAYQAYIDWKQKTEKIEQNRLFFYYKTAKRLSKSKKRAKF